MLLIFFVKSILMNSYTVSNIFVLLVNSAFISKFYHLHIFPARESSILSINISKSICYQLLSIIIKNKELKSSSQLSVHYILCKNITQVAGCNNNSQ